MRYRDCDLVDETCLFVRARDEHEARLRFESHFERLGDSGNSVAIISVTRKRSVAPPWRIPWRIAEYAGILVVAITIFVRLGLIGKSYFWEEDGQAFWMLFILLIPCVSFAFVRPFTIGSLSQQQRFAIAVLHVGAVLMWWSTFGGEWLKRYAEWNSRFAWLFVIAIPALAWYLWLGWTKGSKEGDS